MKESSNNTITCYTDGSRTDSGVGAGFLTTTNNSPHNIINYSSCKLPDFCSLFQAEVTAIREVTTTLQHNRSKTIVIWTDSLSTLQVLSSKLTRSKTVIHCHEALDELAKHNTVHIKWIAAHVGHWGNEKADELAKIGTTSTSLVKGYIPQSHIKALINHKVHLLNQVEWTRNRHTNTMLGNKHKHTIKTLNEQLINNRIHYRTALRLITGHIGLNKHLYNMNITNTTKCPDCDYETETVTHFIGQCPAYPQIRADYFHTYKASHALSDMLWRQKGSWHRMKKTSRALHKILGLCNLWTPGLGNGTFLILILPLHTKRMSVIHLYLLLYFSPLHLYPQKRAKLSELSPCETGRPLRGQTVSASVWKKAPSVKAYLSSR